jgi:hypothetical protein
LNRFAYSYLTFDAFVKKHRPISYLLFLLLLNVGTLGYAQNQKIVELSKKTIPGSARNTAVLAKKLTEKWTKEEDKFLALYTWVINNIKYDVKQLTSSRIKSQTPKKTLRRRKGVCSHYSSLLEDLCSEAGIDCKKIDGNLDRHLWVYDHSDAYHVADHSWNGAKLNGEWELVDATFDAGYVILKRGRFAQFLKRLGIPYVKDKLKFVQAPVYKRYNMKPEEMIVDHLPLAPFWQLLNDPMPIDTFRISLGRKRKYLRNRTKGSFYNFEDSIAYSISDEFPEQFTGYSCSNFNDTNEFSYAFGQERFVYTNLMKYNGTEVEDISDCEERYAEYDTLTYFVNKGKAAFKKQRLIEKKVHLGLLKKQKNRYKKVLKENDKIIARTRSAWKKNKQLIKKQKKQNKLLKIKGEKLEKAKTKQEALKLKTKESDEKPPSRSEVEAKLSLVDAAENEIRNLCLRNDTLNVELSSDFESIFSKMNGVDSLLNKQTLATKEAEYWLMEFYALYDSVYMDSRKRANKWDTLHLAVRDSLLFIITKQIKSLIGEHYKNLTAMKKALKTMQTMYTELSPFLDVDDLGERILLLNKEIVVNQDNQFDLYKKTMKWNDILNGWMKKNREAQKELINRCGWEKSTAGAHRRSNQRFERGRYLHQLKLLSSHQHNLTGYKSEIRSKLKEIKNEIKQRAKENS